MSHLTSEEFKANLEKYRRGTLTEEEEERFEAALEKLDVYQAFLEAEAEETLNDNRSILETERDILRRSQLVAYFRMGLISLVISLLLLPTLNLMAMALDILP